MEQIYLSRRNLLTLLSKLDRAAKGEVTQRTIIKCDDIHQHYKQSVPRILVTAIEDYDYYTDREPGRVNPQDAPCK